MSSPALHSQLTLLEHDGLVRRAEIASHLEYLFRHALVQETVYDSLLRNDRRRLHRIVAESLERENGQTSGSAILLAQHWDQAGEERRALECYLRAGEQAARLYAHKEALMAYDRAVELARGLRLSSSAQRDLYSRRGRILELEGQYPRALEVYQQLEQMAQAENDRSTALHALMHITTVYGTPNSLFDPERAALLSERALEMARALHDRPAEAKVLWTLSMVSFFSGDNEEAVPYGEASVAIARELNLKDQLAYTLNDLARPYTMLGRMNEAQAAVAEARALWLELNNLPMVADNLIGLGMFALFQGNFMAPLESIKEGLRLSREIGNVWGQAYANETLGLLYALSGHFDPALKHLREGLRLGAQVYYLDAQFDGYVMSALVYRTLGAHDRALQVVHEILAKPDISPQWVTLPSAILTLLLTDEGDVAGAEAALAQTEADPNLDRVFLPGIFAQLGRSHLLAAKGQLRAALELATSAAETMQKRKMRPFVSNFLFIKAIVLEQLGEPLEAVRVGELARAEAEEAGMRMNLWEILTFLVQLYMAQGDATRAQETRQAALVEIQFIADNAPPEWRETFLNQVKIRELMHS